METSKKFRISFKNFFCQFQKNKGNFGKMFTKYLKEILKTILTDFWILEVSWSKCEIIKKTLEK